MELNKIRKMTDQEREADGLGWIVPALMGCIIGAFIRKSDKMEVVGEKIRESMDENTQAESDN